jgi:hypothetical protein
MFELYKITNNNDNCNIFSYLNLFLIIIIISIIIISIIQYNPNIEKFANITNSNDLQDNLNLGLCSRKCCPPYWSNDKIIDNRIKDEDIGKSIYTSNLFCSNGDGNKGCICLTDKSVNILSNRGFIK